jgi:hypothetical protein
MNALPDRAITTLATMATTRATRAVLLGASFAAAGAASAATDPALMGCWRTQQVHALYADGSTVESNSDCVTEFGSGIAHARCRTANGVSDTVLAWELAAPGTLRWRPAAAEAPAASAVSATPATPATTSGPGEPGAEVAYTVDGDFVVTTRVPTQPADGEGSWPKALQVVSVRVDPHAHGGCQPRPPNTLRIGRTPHSALALTLPAGWRAHRVDPADTPALAQSIGTDFFVGAFVPRPAAAAATTAAPAASAGAPAPPAPAAVNASTAAPVGPMVIVLDVSRFGATPVRAAEFATLKHDLAGRLPEAETTCETPDRACFLLRNPQGAVGYTELVHVAGRAAIVSAVGPKVGTVPADGLVRAVQLFSERLIRDNR